jgi:hypothetical protein
MIIPQKDVPGSSSHAGTKSLVWLELLSNEDVIAKRAAREQVAAVRSLQPRDFFSKNEEQRRKRIGTTTSGTCQSNGVTHD